MLEQPFIGTFRQKLRTAKSRAYRRLDYYQKVRLPELNYQLSRESQKWRQQKNKYAGKRCFILGNGPSLKRQDLALLKNEITFVTNWFVLSDEYEKIKPTFHCICAHEIFGGWTKNVDFNANLHALLKEKSQGTIKVFPFCFKSGVQEQSLFDNKEVAYLFYEPPVQDVDQIKKINLDIANQKMLMGHTVITIFCLPMAFYLGFEEIYLLGCDCDYGVKNQGDKRSYFYDSSLHTSEAPPADWLQQSWAADGPMIQGYAIASHEFEKRGKKIFNATDGGKLEVFPRVSYGELFNSGTNK